MAGRDDKAIQDGAVIKIGAAGMVENVVTVIIKIPRRADIAAENGLVQTGIAIIPAWGSASGKTAVDSDTVF